MKKLQSTHPVGLVFEILGRLCLAMLRGAVAGIAIAETIRFLSKRDDP